MSYNMRLLYIVRFLRDLINKLIGFFIPIYIYKRVIEGVFASFLPSAGVSQALLAIALYFGIYRLATLLTSLLAAKIGTRFGHRATLFISHVALGLNVLLLFFSHTHPLLIFAAALFEGVQVSFFWPSYFTLVARRALKKHLGEDLGLIQFLLKLAALVSPVLGGLVITIFGFHNLFLVGVALVILTTSMVALMHPEPEQDTVSLGELRNWLKEKAFVSQAISYGGRYINDATLVLWPVYIFILLGSVVSVGYLYTLSLFLALLLTFFGAVYVDRAKTRKPFYLSGVILSALWMFRIGVGNFWQIILLDTADKLTADFYSLCYDTFCLRRGRGDEAYSFFMYREIIVSFSALLFWGLVALLFYRF